MDSAYNDPQQPLHMTRIVEWCCNEKALCADNKKNPPRMNTAKHISPLHRPLYFASTVCWWWLLLLLLLLCVLCLKDEQVTVQENVHVTQENKCLLFENKI